MRNSVHLKVHTLMRRFRCGRDWRGAAGGHRSGRHGVADARRLRVTEPRKARPEGSRPVYNVNYQFIAHGLLLMIESEHEEV